LPPTLGTLPAAPTATWKARRVERRRRVRQRHAVERLGQAIAADASDDSSYVTGIELFVDGGMAQV
jgi:hypothetical protein